MVSYKFKLLLATLMLMLSLALCSPALALTVSTNKQLYGAGEAVTVTGQTTPNSWVTIKLLNPNGVLVAIDQKQATPTGSYATSFVLPASMPSGNYIFGEYTVQAYSTGEGVTKSATFTVQAPPAVYAWVRYTPSSSEVLVNVTVDTTATAAVELAQGLNVTSWGTVSRDGNVFSVDLEVYRWNGTAAPTVPEENRAHAYGLGALSPGGYAFVVKAWGTSAKSQAFEVPDLEPPVISSVMPLNGSTVNVTRPIIAVGYSDNVQVNTSAVRLYLDGIDVTGQCNITSSGLYYKPPSDLSNRTYQARVVVKDLYGNAAEASWSFTVSIPPPPPTTQPGVSKCLIATAAYGSELALPVQALRDFRDNYVMKTASGSNFMEVFNAWYYSWSPYVAELERQNDFLREAVKSALKPLIAELAVAEVVFDAFNFNQELAVTVAGIVASALIGLTYLAPVALAASLALRQRLNPRRVMKAAKLLSYAATLAIALHVLALSIYAPLLSASSALIVLTAAALAALTPLILVKRVR